MVRDRHEAAASFLEMLQGEAAKLNGLITQDDGDWIVKGFIDIFRNVYTISGDTKVVSKLIELMIFPQFVEFAATNELELIPSSEQNHYPDMTFVAKDGHRFAVDLKSTYRRRGDVVNTMTLGAFTGYFRDRTSSKNATFPYGSYSAHIVLGVIYSRSKIKSDEFVKYAVDDLESIPSVVRDLQFFAQPKYRIAKSNPGSGNTKNIGAVSSLSALVNGTGPFSELGEEIFDDYWRFYMTAGMAKAAELEKAPYTNLESYLKYKQIPVAAPTEEDE